MKKIAVIRNTELVRNCETLEKIETLSRKYGILTATLPDGELPSPDTDMVLVLGGDGTMLRAAKAVLDTGIPILGINLGRLGYLAEVPEEEIDQAFDSLSRGNYHIENRMLLHGTVIKNGEVVAEEHALNDIVISRTGLLRAYSLPLYVNGSLLNTFTADGIIASTATGSTGYSLSAGGPVVSPEAEIILITPLASHSLISRSIILSGTDEIRIEAGRGRTGYEENVCSVLFDGNPGILLSTGDSVVIRKSDRVAGFVKISRMSFLDVLRKKMAEI
ncbi:MAG: NAD(+)/NADH kinase [Lachnospiraceae bacterium]|nr:NAD(+)/NADH kinase [Lachnospiraceae bacterium]